MTEGEFERMWSALPLWKRAMAMVIGVPIYSFGLFLYLTAIMGAFPKF